MGVKGFAGRRCAAVVMLLVMTVSGGVPHASASAVERTLTIAGPSAAALATLLPYTGRLAVDTVGLPGERIVVEVGGQVVGTATTAIDGTYSISLSFPTNGLHAVQAVAYQGSPIELRSPVLQVVVYDDSAATNLYEAAQFLYTGSNAVQTGVDEDAIDPATAAVLRGRVTTSSGEALSGVKVSVGGHPEFGETVTQAGGGFDMVVNGGQSLVVEYGKDGFIPVQREVLPTWRDYEFVEDVIMIPYDSAVSTIALSAGQMQVAQGSVVTDADGTRRSTMLFPPGVDAVMRLADGTVQPLDTLNVRATEYTAGDMGVRAMPGELPGESAYTYAVEFSADEAVAAGATTVEFTQPVVNYLENFLGFPVGTAVPTGYYDRQRRAWIGSDNGRVVAIVGSTAGLADLDTDGDGLADSAAALAELGVTTEERANLGTLYATGQSLWRVPIPHFTPWDHNWPYGLPDDAVAPSQGTPKSSQSSVQCERDGSIVGCENQTLGEVLPLAGTPFHLRYDSGRVPGRVAERALTIPLTGTEVPNSLESVRLDVTVAGRRFTQSFPAAPDLEHVFVWDGQDAYGRVVQGMQTATVRIGYVYGAVYYEPAQFRVSFGQAGSAPLQANETRNEITVFQEYETGIGGAHGPALQSLGGWTFSPLHAYDPEGRVLHLGSGGRRAVDAVAAAIAAMAGSGAPGPRNEGTYSGDGGLAKQAGLSFVRGVTVAEDGSVYIADTGNGVVRKVDRNQVITTFAGGGAPPAGNGDGGPATLAELVSPTDLAVGPDGSVYISDPGDARVRRVAPDGVISTFAGGGQPVDGVGDGGPATDAKLPSPRGVAIGRNGAVFIADAQQHRVRRVGADGTIVTIAGGGAPADGLGDGLPGPQSALALPLGVAVDDTGALYVSDANHDRIRRVRRDGVIETFAGTGLHGYSGDGGPATAARIGHPAGIAVDPTDGSVLFAQRLHHRIRKVLPDGTIVTAAGTGIDSSGGEQGPPLHANLHEPHDVAVDPDGVVYVADTDNFQIRRVAPPLPGFGATDILVPSEDGTELYEFSTDGRHLRTRDALTNVVIHQFGRDTHDRVITVTDAFGNVTTIERDSAGRPTAIVAPFGQRTTLTHNAEGYLETVRNPANETVSLGYGAGGLLTGLTTPRGAAHSFTYDALGRLLVDQAPDGNSTTLARTDTPTGVRVTATTAEGRITTYEIEHMADGSARRTVTYPSGATEITTARLDGTAVNTTSDGTSSSVRLGPDPRWGMLAPLPTEATTTLPSGLSVTTTRGRTVTLADPLNPLSLVSQTDTATTNAKITTTVYDAVARTVTTTTAGGRVESKTLNAQGLVVGSQQGSLAPTEFEYDVRGRLVTLTEGTGASARVTTYAYGTDGYLSAVTDAEGNQVTFERDAVGRVTASTLPGSHRPTYGYDATGNLTALTPPGKPAHAFDYTPGNLPSAYRPPDGSPPLATTFAYNLDRQPTQTNTPDGRTVTYGYDAGGRPATTSFSRGQIVTSYNTASQVSQTTAPGGEQIELAYDGNLVTGIVASGTAAGSVDYGYGPDLQRTSRALNGGPATAFASDSDGFPTAAGALTLTWDSTNGALTGTSLGSLTTTHGHNSHGESTSVNATAGATTLYSASHERDALGRIVRTTETVDGTTHVYDYVYDARGQLEQVSTDGSLTRAYAYDSNGNRTTVTGGSTPTTATVDDQDRLLTQGAATYTSTPAGDLATKTDPSGTTTYSYDELGNLVQVVLPAGTVVAYTIDGANRRVAKSVDGAVVRRWLYGDGPAPVAELDVAGNVIAEYVYAARPSVPDYIVKSGVTYRVLTDSIGSVRLVVDASTGVIAQRIDYDEFGNIQVDSAPGFQPFGFAGGLYDSDTGLVRFGARDYDSVTGRWTSRDPIGFESGTNLYLYAGNDPVNNVDLSGLDWVQDFGDFAAGFGDTISFGLTRRARQALGVDGAVGKCSGFYTAGSYTSIAIDIASGVKGAVGVVKWGSRSWRGRGAARAAIAPNTPTAEWAVGRRGSPMDVPRGTNPPATIGGRQYGGHALDEMMSEGFTPSLVDDAIRHGQATTGASGRVGYYSATNNVTVILENGRVVTVTSGMLKIR